MKLLKELTEAFGQPRPKYTWDEAVDRATKAAHKSRDDALIIRKNGDEPDEYDVIMELAFLHWPFRFRDQVEVVARVNWKGKVHHYSHHVKEAVEHKPAQRFFDNLLQHKPRAKDKTDLVMKMIDKGQVSDLIDWIGIVNREKIFDTLGRDVTMDKLIKALSTSAGWKKFTSFKGY